MYNSLLTTLFKSLNNNHLKTINKALKSDDPKKETRLYCLFKFFRKNHPALEEKKLEKAKVFHAVFPGSAYNSNKLDKLSNKLINEIEVILAGDFLAKKGQERAFYAQLYQSFLPESQADYFSQIAKKWHNAIQQQQEDTVTYWYQYHYHNQQASLAHLSPASPGWSTLENADVAMEKAYVLWKLRYWVEKLNRSRKLKEPDLPEIDAKILEQAKTLATADNPLIHLYYELLLLNQDYTNETQLHHCRMLLQSYLKQICSKQSHMILRHLANICIGQLPVDEKKFRQHETELYHLGIKHGIILLDGVLPYTLFLNIVVAFSATKDFKNALSFIKKHKTFTPMEKQTASEHLALAYYYFHQNRYELAEKEIDSISEHEAHFGLLRQSLLIRITFEWFLEAPEERDDLIENRINAFSQFFSRNSYDFSDAKRSSYLNLKDYILGMVRYQLDLPNQPDLLELVAQLDEKPPATRLWVEKTLMKLIGQTR